MGKVIYKGLGNRQPKWKLDFIVKNAASYSARELSEKTALSIPFIYDYCKLKGIHLKKRVYVRTQVDTILLPVHGRIKRFSQQNPVSIQRPPAIYDNRTREELINELLNEKVA